MSEKLVRSDFKSLFKPEVFNLKPEDCESEEEFLDIVADEAWNLDEWTPEGVMMMKHFILKITTTGYDKKKINSNSIRESVKQFWNVSKIFQDGDNE